jgi:hypothetical protein
MIGSEKGSGRQNIGRSLFSERRAADASVKTTIS